MGGNYSQINVDAAAAARYTEDGSRFHFPSFRLFSSVRAMQQDVSVIQSTTSLRRPSLRRTTLTGNSVTCSFLCRLNCSQVLICPDDGRLPPVVSTLLSDSPPLPPPPMEDLAADYGPAAAYGAIRHNSVPDWVPANYVEKGSWCS